MLSNSRSGGSISMTPKKPRILIFSLAYLPLVGGAELALKEITDRLGDVFNFDLITHRFDKTWPAFESFGKVNVYRIGKGSGSYFGQKFGKMMFIFRAYFLASKLHRQNHYQIIWAIMASYGGLSALLFKLRYKKVKFLLTLQEGDSEKHILSRVGIFYPFWRLIFKKADYIQAISNYLADFARRHGAKCQIAVVPNGVDLQKFKSQNLKVKSSSQNSKVIITTSRLVYKNGIDILIKAVAELKAKNYKLKVIIVGSGPEDQNLKKLAKNLGLSNEVIFLGHIEPDKIPEYLYQADVFVRPSRSEGLGNSFLEAMAAGLPVIGTAVGGIPDFLEDEVTGLFCKAEDHNDLAEKIKLLLSDSNLSNKLSQNGWQLVEANYSWDVITLKIRDVFNNLLCAY